MAFRQRGGPWVVTESKSADGNPIITIEHLRLFPDGVVTLSFPGEKFPERFTNAPLRRIFRAPNTNSLPFGPVEFVDVTFLPGTVAVDAFGHLIEMVPRTLYLDGQEIPWTPGTNIIVPLTGKIPKDRLPKPKR